ncbi:MAG: ABC transporter permease subunit [Proteobacteria bacterium]|nr:ABC transporter permease subunit [Pseudomonadota bacterium]
MPTPAEKPDPKPPQRRRPGIGTVLERELIRSARRPQTYSLRAGFALMLLGLIAVWWAEEVQGRTGMDRQGLASQGQFIFQLYVWVQWAVLGVLTPILIAQSVIEEREGKTLKLLTITNLGAGRILVGKWLSRVIGLELLILAGLPPLALTLSLGGVELWQLLSAWLQLTTLVMSGGAVAAFLALYAKGPFSVAIATWVWMICAFTMGFIPHGAVVQTEGSLAWMSPFYALILAKEWSVTVGPILGFGMVTAAVLHLGALGFRAAMSGADDPLQGFGTLSGDFEGLRKVKTRLAILMVVLLAATPLMMVQKAIETFVPADWMKIAISSGSWIWAVLWIWLATGVYLLVVRAAYIQLGRRRSKRHDRSWKELVRNWEPAAAPSTARSIEPDSDAAEANAWAERPAVPLSVPLSGRNLSGRSVDEAAPGRKARFSVVRSVWRNPVLWREVVTRAHGGLSKMILRSYVVVALIGGFFFFIGLLAVSPGLSLFCGFSGFAMAALVVLMTSTASIAGELRNSTLELLCATRMSALRILWGKLLAAWALAAPAYLAGVVATALGVSLVLADSFEYRSFDRLEAFGVLLSWGGVTLWYGVALTTVVAVCHWIGLRAESASRVWMWTIGWATAMLVLPPLAAAIFDNQASIRAVIGLINPLLDEATWDVDDPPIVLFCSIGVWLMFTAALFVDNAYRLPRRASRG